MDEFMQAAIAEAQAGFDEACAAGARYQTACYAAGEPQRVLGPRLAKRSK